jgi:hypothetical protein
MAIVPVARSMYLCDQIIGYQDARTDLYGIFSGLEPAGGFPYRHGPFYVYAQLVNGFGTVPFRFDIVFANSDELLFSTTSRNLTFPNRTTVVQLSFQVPGFRFHRPGRYLFELYCDNIWVCDCPLQLRRHRQD